MGLMQRFGERLKRGFTEAISTMAEALGKLRAVELGTSSEEFKCIFFIYFPPIWFFKILLLKS